MDARTDRILNDLIDAHQRLLNGRAKRAAEEEEDLAARDAALVRARKTGIAAAELARLLDVKRDTVYKALDRAGLQS